MRRSAGVWLMMAMIFLAACTGGLATQNPKPAPVEPAPPAQDVPTEQAPDWQSELDQITDLLIDEKPQEAKERAEQLLAAESLPEDVASRARTLRDKADAKLAEAAPKPEIESPAGKGSSKKTEKTTAGKAPRDQSFKVRVAAIGSGFSQGVSGVLRISETGISFIPQGKTGENWSIRWPDLAEAKSDTGLWDAPYPLVLVERGGRKRYVARLDQKGSYVTGAPLLSAIAEGRRK